MSDKKVVIISDSTSDLNDEIIKKYDIKIVPLYITLNGETYKDRLEISPEDIYENYAKNKQLPKTSASNIQDHADMIEKYINDCEGIVYFTISSEMSSNYNNARIAAEDYDNVYVIDSRNLSTGIGLSILHAAELAEQGKSAKEIADSVNEYINKVDSSFVVDNLEYLAKGGRCSSVAALGANILKIRPCITVRNGKMGMAKKYRGPMEKVFVEYVNDILSNPDDIDGSKVFITDSTVSKECHDAVVEAVKSKNIFKEFHFTKAGCTISSHCGKGCLGVLFAHKTDIK